MKPAPPVRRIERSGRTLGEIGSGAGVRRKGDYDGLNGFDWIENLWCPFITMKSSSILTLGAGSLFLASCGLFDPTSQTLSGAYDPLSSPGSSPGPEGASVVAPKYQPGEWVETATPYVGFFRSIPKSGARAVKTLPLATPMKVVATKETYLKVELDSGEVGYVPQINVMARNEEPEPAAITDYGPIPPPVDPALDDRAAQPPATRNGVPPTPVPGTDPAPVAPSVPVPPVPVPVRPDSSVPPPEPKPVRPSTLPPTVPGITDE